MRYLAFHEDKCIISDVASDMPIINGTVLGKPICEVIHGIFAERVGDLGGDITCAVMELLKHATRVSDYCVVINNPYLCVYCSHDFHIDQLDHHIIDRSGYVEHIWYKNTYCDHYPKIYADSCTRCLHFAELGVGVYECIKCQRKPPLPVSAKCAECGHIWTPTCDADFCVVCNDNEELVEISRSVKKCRGCKCSFDTSSFVTIGIYYRYIDYCNDCILSRVNTCFICTDIVDAAAYCKPLRYDNGELYVYNSHEIERVSVVVYKDSPFAGTIREYNRSRFDKMMLYHQNVRCHATCVNIACNLNIFVK